MGMVENLTKDELIDLIKRKFDDDCKYTIVNVNNKEYSIFKLEKQTVLAN